MLNPCEKYRAFPFVRVLLPNSKGSEILKDKAAAFELLSRIDFEALVRKAAEAQAMTRSAPRLVRASYVAEFKGAALINGTGSWEIANPSGAAALLRIPKLNLALA